MTYDKHVLAGIYKRVSHFPQELPGSGKELLKALAAVHRLGVFLGCRKRSAMGLPGLSKLYSMPSQAPKLISTSRSSGIIGIFRPRRTISAVSRARISGEQ